MPAARGFRLQSGRDVPFDRGVPIAPPGTAVTPPPPPPVGGIGMLVGESRDNGNTALFTSMASAAGPYTVSRAYQPGQFKATWAADVGGVDVGQRATVYSCKPDMTAMSNGTLDAALTAFVQSIPDSHLAVLSCWHEPDVKYRKGTLDITLWKAANTRFMQVVKAVGKPHVYTAIILTNYSAIGGVPTSSQPSAFWFGPDGASRLIDIVGWDMYLFNNTPTTGAHEQLACVQFCQSHGAGYGIAEIGLTDSVTDMTVGASWMHTQADYAYTSGAAGPHRSAAFLTWFDQNISTVLVPSASPTLITAAASISTQYQTPYTTFVL